MEIASRAPEMGNLQSKLERLEALRPRLQADVARIGEVLQPLAAQPCDAPEPAPVTVKVAPAPAAPEPVVIVPASEKQSSPTVVTTGAGGPVVVSGGGSTLEQPGSVSELARHALDSVKSAGGSPVLEDQISDLAKKATGSSDEGSGNSYAKVGGSGAQASLQTSAKVKTASSGSGGPSLAKKALEALGGGSEGSSTQSAPVKPSTSGGDLKSAAKRALDALGGGSADGGSGQPTTSLQSSGGEKYSGDDVARLARQAIR